MIIQSTVWYLYKSDQFKVHKIIIKSSSWYLHIGEQCKVYKIIQSNLCKAGTLRKDVFVCFGQVSALDRLGLSDFTSKLIFWDKILCPL